MQIAIIGSGRVGTALGRRFSEAGHSIAFGSRNPSEEAVQATAASVGAGVLSPAEAVEWSDIVLLAVPWTAVREAVAGLGDLEGKILVDATNPVALGQPDVELPGAMGFASGAQAIASWAPSASVVKAFNTTGAANLANPSIGGATVPALLCGDGDAVATVADLAGSSGFDPIVVGGLGSAALTEATALLWITLAYQQGMGPDFAFVVARR